jgi:hypothetical protein
MNDYPPAGRELDLLVAQRLKVPLVRSEEMPPCTEITLDGFVRDLATCGETWVINTGEQWVTETFESRVIRNRVKPVPRYSTDPAAAWFILHGMRSPARTAMFAAFAAALQEQCPTVRELLFSLSPEMICHAALAATEEQPE